MSFDERLISAVQGYGMLYDLSHKDYYNIVMKDTAWEEISTNLNEDCAVIKKRWNNLRDSYRKALAKKKTKSGQANKNIKPWKYEEQMSFLNDHMSDKRPHISNIEYADDNETDVGDYDAEKTAEHLSDVSETEQSSPLNPPKIHASSSRVVRKKGQESTSTSQVAGVLENYFSKKTHSKNTTSDHLTSFFKSAEDTVRTFTPFFQVEIKSKIASLLSEYEMKNLIEAEHIPWSTGTRTTSSSLRTTPSPMLPSLTGEQTPGEFQHYSRVSPAPNLQSHGTPQSTSSMYNRKMDINTDQYNVPHGSNLQTQMPHQPNVSSNNQGNFNTDFSSNTYRKL